MYQKCTGEHQRYNPNSCLLLQSGGVRNLGWGITPALAGRGSELQISPSQLISSPDSYFLQKAEFLQLPLMVKDETVTARSPASQVLLSTHVGYRGVQHAPTPSLHAYRDRCTADRTDTWPHPNRYAVRPGLPVNGRAEMQHPPGLPASATRQRLSS